MYTCYFWRNWVEIRASILDLNGELHRFRYESLGEITGIPDVLIDSWFRILQIQTCEIGKAFSAQLLKNKLREIKNSPSLCQQENLRKHVLSTNKHPDKYMYECKFCDDPDGGFATNFSKEFQVHLITSHCDRFESNKMAASYVFSMLYNPAEDQQPSVVPIENNRKTRYVKTNTTINMYIKQKILFQVSKHQAGRILHHDYYFNGSYILFHIDRTDINQGNPDGPLDFRRRTRAPPRLLHRRIRRRLQPEHRHSLRRASFSRNRNLDHGRTVRRRSFRNPRPIPRTFRRTWQLKPQKTFPCKNVAYHQIVCNKTTHPYCKYSG